MGNNNNPYIALIKAKSTNIGSCNVNQNTKIICSIAFYNCIALSKITIPNGVKIIGDSAFTKCINLIDIALPDSIIYIGNDIFGEHIYSYPYRKKYNEYNGALYIGNSKNPYLAIIDIKDRQATTYSIHPNTKVICGGSLRYCKSLENITIPKSIIGIGESAFEMQKNLTRITIPDSVRRIGGHVFDDCDTLTIYCETTSRPVGWSKFWNPSNRPVVWGHKTN